MKTALNFNPVHLAGLTGLLTRAALFFAVAVSCGAQTVTVTAPQPTPYSIVSAGLDWDVLQSTNYEMLPSGQVIPHIRSYEERATGLNFDPGTGKLEPSKSEVDVLPDNSGLAATNGQHSVFWPNDIATDVIRLVEPGGQQLESVPLGVVYFDGTNFATLAVLTNAAAQLVGSSQVLFSHSFFGLNCSLLYSYTKAGLEQNLILLQQPPTPQSLGLNPGTTRLQLWTEFFDSPQPTISASTVSTAAGDLENDSLTFGTMSMTSGKAFMLGSVAPPVGVERHWLTQNGEQILVEEVPLASISDGLASLPLGRTSSRKVHLPKNLLFAKRHVTPHVTGQRPRRISRAKAPRSGLILDYQIVNGNSTNLTFRSDATYYISSELYLFGTNNDFEGGSIIKFANSASIDVEGSVQTLVGADRPVILTCKDDNTIGSSINGSTGSPSGYYANPALEISSSAGLPGPLSKLRISYAQTGIEIDQQKAQFFDVQMMNCGVGCQVIDGSATFENALFGNVLTNFFLGSGSEAQATNATFSASLSLATGSSGALSLGNCILANVTNNGSATISADFDGFYDSPAFGSDQTTNSSYPFLQAGGGSYYLANANANTFRGFGTTNIDPALVAELQNKTTYAPIVYINTNITGLGTLSPWAPRETNSVDLGWAYDPIDFAFGGCNVSGVLTITSGTTVGCFGDSTSGSAYGIELGNGGGLTFEGNATQPCMFVFADMVQEGDDGNWTAGENGSELGGLVFSGSSAGPEPLVSANFTKVVSDNVRNLFRDSPGWGAGVFKNCEFYNAFASTYEMQYLTFTNCLFFRGCLQAWDTSYVLSLTNENCSYYNGELALDRESWENGYSQSFWSIENTIFDGTLLVYLDDDNGGAAHTLFEYNAYNTNNLSWQTYGFPYSNWTITNILENLDLSDVMVTNFWWIQGVFGDFYVQATSPVIGAGGTNANFLGLYHFTSVTNVDPAVVEGTNKVNIGYCYVATDTNASPLDSNGDGVPDYLEDPLGNGLPYDGTNWALAINQQPADETVIVGTNAALGVIAGGVGTLFYQWYFNSNIVAWATSATLVLTNVQTTNDGEYFVVVTNGFGAVTSSVVSLTATYIVYPGPDETITNYSLNIQNTSFFLQGVISAVGNNLPGPTDAVWSVVSAPAATTNTIYEPNLTNSPATFSGGISSVGTYELTLSVTNNGHWAGSSNVFITVVSWWDPVPYNDEGYRYAYETSDILTNFYTTNYDDSGWTNGQAGFGNDKAGCYLVPNTTNWPGHDGGFPYLYVRKHFNVAPGTTNLTMGFTVDNDAQIFLNGYLLTPQLTTNVITGETNAPNIQQTVYNGINGWSYVYYDDGVYLTNYFYHTNCCEIDDLVLNGLSTNVWHTGDNLLAVRVYDDGDVSYFDGHITLQWVTTNGPPAPVQIISPVNQYLLSGTNTTVVATNTASGSGIPLSRVEFFDNGNPIGFAISTNNLYDVPWMPIAEGPRVLTALAVDTNGLGSWSAPVTNYVRALPTIAIISPTNTANLGSMFANVTIAAAVTSAGAAITNVSYYANGSLIGSNLSWPYQLSWPHVANGNYTLTASATDTNGATGISPNVIVTVDQSNQPPFVSAGPNQVTNLPSAQLAGFVSDDGLPTNYLAVWWSLISGPTGGTVIFGNSNLPATTATFSTTGTNVLQLSGTDGQYTNTSRVQIIVLETNLPPVVSAPPIQMAFWPEPSTNNILPWLIPDSIYPTNGYPMAVPFYNIAYNAISNCLVTDGLYDTGSSDGSGDEVYEEDLFYLDKSFNITYDLGPIGEIDQGVESGTTLATVTDTSGGFSIGDTFACTSPGVVLRVKPNGTIVGTNTYYDSTGTPQSNAWVVIAAEENAQGVYHNFASFCFDTGGAWGGDLLGVCADGNVWRVNSEGSFAWVAQVHPSGQNEYTPFDLTTVILPESISNYGPWAGRLLVSSIPENCIYAIDTNGFVVSYNMAFTGALLGGQITEDENLVDWAPGPPPIALSFISASQLDGMNGDIFMAGGAETSLESSDGPLERFHWNGTSFDIYECGLSGFPGQGASIFSTYCPLGLTNISSTVFQLQATVSDDGKLFSPTANSWAEMSGPGSVVFSDPTLTNTAAQFSAPGRYVLRFSAYDGQFTTSTNVEVDVTYNAAPTVSAGTNQIIPGTNTTLTCLIQDDGLPSNQLSITWSVVSSPYGGQANLNWTNEVINSTNDTLTDTVNFSAPGTYIFEVTASDGLAVGSSEVTVTVESDYLTLSPVYGWPTLTNIPFTVTATFVDSNDSPIANAEIDFSINGTSGASNGPPLYTGTNGTVSFTYTGQNQGGDVITASVSHQPYQASVNKDWAMAMTCDTVQDEPGNWSSTSLSIPTNNSGGFAADYYAFQGNEGSTVTLSFSNYFVQDGLALFVRDPSNNIVAVCDSAMVNESDDMAFGQLTLPVNVSGNYLIEVVNFGMFANEGSVFDSPGYALALSCNDGTNVYAGTVPEMQLWCNGKIITSGGTVLFPATVPTVPTNVSLTISNVGSGDLTIGNIWTNSEYGGSFIISNDFSSSTVSPGGSTNFIVFFYPSTNGTILGQLFFSCNLLNGGSYMAYMSGTAFSNGAPPSIIITSPQDFSTYYAPAVVPLTAQVSPGITNVASVAFEEITTNGAVFIGNASLITTNEWGLTWSEAVTGNYTITAVASDAVGRTSTSPPLYLTVNPFDLTNAPPLVTNLQFSVQENSINNMLNPLAYARDLSGNPMTITVISQPLDGTASIVDNGTEISYTPAPDYCSESVGGVLQPFDFIEYEVSDERGRTSGAEITIFVDPTIPPVANITSPPSPWTTNAGAVTPIVATITNVPSQYMSQVQFYLYTNLVGVVTNGNNGTYSLNWTNIYYGSEAEIFTALASDIFGDAALSPPLQINIQPPSGNALVASLNYFVGSGGTNSFSTAGGGQSDICYIRDGVFQLYGIATNSNPNVTWMLGVYSSDGSTLLRNLTPASTGPVGTANSPGLLLNTCDLTTLQNGAYDLRLTVIGGGAAATSDVFFALESNLKIGQFSFSQQDLVIPVNGIPLTVTRTYNSQNPDKGDFGYGWTFTLSDMDVQLDETRAEVQDYNGRTFSQRTGGGRDVTLTLPNGQRTTFYYFPSYFPLKIQYTPEWVNAPGMPSHGALSLAPGQNSAQVEDYWPIVFEGEGQGSNIEPYWEDYADGTDVPDEVYDFPGFNLWTPDGTVYVLKRPSLGKHTMAGGILGDGYIDQAWGTPYLAQIIEANGSTITISSNGIAYASANGIETNQITFQRNSQGLISSVSDPTSIASGGPPAVKYEYDANGNLMYVERLVNRSTASYVTNYFFYTNSAAPHFITSILNGDGTQVAQNYYDSTGKLVKTVDASGNTTYFNNNLTNNTEAVVDRMGYTNNYVYDTRGNVIVQTDALGETTTNSYDSNNNLLSTTDPLDNTTTYGYDGNNNRTMMVDALGHTNRYSYNSFNQLTNQTDPLGNTVASTYDNFGILLNTEQLDTNGDMVTETSYGYENFHVSEITNANGQCTANFVYDPSSGYMTSSTDANGLTRYFGCDVNGNQTNSCYLWTPPGGGTPQLVTNETFYDGQNRITMTIDQYGDTNLTFYDLNGRITYTTDKFGNTNSFLYDARGNQIQATDAKGNVTYTVYDLDSRPILTTDPNGVTGTLTQYDAVGRATNVVRLENVQASLIPDPSAPGQMTTVIASYGTGLSTNSTTYFANGWVQSRTSPDGTTSYSYFANGQTKSVINPLTNATYYYYDPAGRQNQVQDALNRSTQFQIDAAGRRIATIFNDGTSISNIFNNVGQKVGTIDQAGLLTQYGYDVAGDLTNVIKPQVPGGVLPPAWSYQYDEYGRLTVTTDPNNHSTTNFYNALGNQVAQGLPMGQVNTSSTNNSKGMLWKQFDFMGQMIEHRYDNFGRETNKYYFAAGATDPSYAVSYGYNQLDQLTNVTQLYGSAASSGYEPLAMNGGPGRIPMFARLNAMVNGRPGLFGGATTLLMLSLAMAMVPAEKRRRFVLEVVAGLTGSISSLRGERTRLACPGLRPRRPDNLRMPSLFLRFVSVFTMLAVLASEPGFYQLCTAQGQCVYPSNPSDPPSSYVTTFTYDFDGRVIQVNSPEGVINYTYDLATGRMTELCTTNSEQDYDYDSLGRLHSVTVAKRNGVVVTGETTMYGYDAVGNRASVSLPNGIVTKYNYDDLNRLTNEVSTNSSGTLLADYSYALDATGRRTNAVEVLQQEGGAGYQTNNLTWRFDAIYRLTNEICLSKTAGSPYAYTNSFTYDSAGNRLQKVRTGAGAVTDSYIYDANDELTNEADASTVITYRYDQNGSLTNKTSGAGTTVDSYAYDLANKLDTVSVDGSQQASYLYNDQGIRVESSATGGGTTHFLVDDNNQTGNAQVLEELPGLGATPTMSYMIGDDVLAQCGTTATAPSYFLQDGHGNNRQLTALDGTVSYHYDYEAYGAIQSSISSSGESSAATTKLFCGEQYDSALQMYNLRARYYDPIVGRFNQRDTFAGNSADPQSLHKYLYSSCDPINQVDPTGQFSLIELLIVVIVIAVLALAIAFVWNSDTVRRGIRIPWTTRVPNATEQSKLDKAKNLLIKDSLVQQAQGIDIMSIKLFTEETAGKHSIGESVPGSWVITMRDTWLNQASSDANVIDTNTLRVALQIYGEGLHAMGGVGDTPEGDAQFQNAKTVLGLGNDPVVAHWGLHQ